MSTNKNHKKKKKKDYLNTKKANQKVGVSSFSIRNLKPAYVIFSVLLFIFILYIKVFQNEFTNRDDNVYILGNPYISTLSIENITNIFSGFFMGNYHPLSMLVLSIGYQIGGFSPWIYQLINLLLHITNVFLVYIFIKTLFSLKEFSRKKTYFISIVTSILFGIHTIQVESVAWVSENKNVLYTLFFLLSLIYYLKYIDSKNIKFYLVALALFLVSLFSKGMAVSLALTLVITDIYLERKVFKRTVILEKLPFLILSVIFGIIAVIAQSDAVNMTNKVGEYSLFRAFAYASYGFFQYLIKIIVPIRLSALYEYLFLLNGAMPVKFYFYLGLGIIISILLILFLKRNTVYFFGFFFFLVNILLVLQIIPVGDAIMADRYAYIPSIGLFIILSYVLYLSIERFSKYRMYVIALFICYLLFISFLTVKRIGVWKDSYTLWTDVLAKSNYSKYSNVWLIRGTLLNQQQKYKEALNDINVHFKAHGVTSTAYFQRAYAKSFLNDDWGAIEDYTLAEEMDSSNHHIYLNRATIKNKIRYCLDGYSDYSNAIALCDTSVDAYNGRAESHICMGNYTEALNDFNKSIVLNPNNAVVYNNRAAVKKKLGLFEEALMDLNIAIRLNRDLMEAYQNRVDVYMALENYNSAIVDLDLILALQKIPVAYYYRGMAKYKLGKFDAACNDFSTAALSGYAGIEPEYLKPCN